MKYLPLIWAGLWRTPLRTVLTALSIIAAFLVLGMLESVSAAFSSFVASERTDRIHVHPKYNNWMPFSYLHQIEGIPGILAIAYDIPPGGYFREPKNGFGVIWTDAETIFTVEPEFQVSPEALDAYKHTPDGVLVSRKLAERFAWKVGDHVTIGSQSNLRTDGTEMWPFDIVGIFDQSRPEPGCCVLENYKYFSDSSATNSGQVGEFMIRVKDPKQASDIASAIDKLFENSPAATQTDLEKDANFGRGNPISLIMRTAMTAGFSIILIVATVTTLQSLRERIREFGVLKALGFANEDILAIVVGESLVLMLTGAMIGFAIAVLLMRFLVPPPFGGEIRVAAVYWGVVSALAAAAATSALPVWRASRLDAAKILSDA